QDVVAKVDAIRRELLVDTTTNSARRCGIVLAVVNVAGGIVVGVLCRGISDTRVDWAIRQRIGVDVVVQPVMIGICARQDQPSLSRVITLGVVAVRVAIVGVVRAVGIDRRQTRAVSGVDTVGANRAAGRDVARGGLGLDVVGDAVAVAVSIATVGDAV